MQKSLARSKNISQFKDLKKRKELAFLGYKAGCWEWNLQTDEAFYSKEWNTMLGYENRDVYADITVWSSLVHPDDLKLVMADVEYAFKKKLPSVEAIHRLKSANGEWTWVLGRGAIEYDEEGKPLNMVGIHTDITQQKQQELKIMQQAQIIEQVPDAIILLSLEGKVLSWNKGSETLFQYRQEEILHKDISVIFPARFQKRFHKWLKYLVTYCKRHRNVHFETILLQKDTSTVDVSLSFSLLRDENGLVSAIVIYGQDITQRVAIYKKLFLQKEQLDYQAHHDTLTKLPNRIYFQKRLQESIEHLQKGERLALLFVDLDNFKHINDTYGHSIGDKVLYETAKRLQRSVRKSDFIARLSGDEFTIILVDVPDVENVKKIVENILKILPQKMVINKHTINLSCSIGISIYPDDTNNSEKLLMYADSAMYEAKKSGKNTFKLYSLMI